MTDFGLAVLAWVGMVTWHEITFLSKDVSLILFGSRIGETVGLGVGVNLIHYFLIGSLLLMRGSLTFLWRRGKT